MNPSKGRRNGKELHMASYDEIGSKVAELGYVLGMLHLSNCMMRVM